MVNVFIQKGLEQNGTKDLGYCSESFLLHHKKRLKKVFLYQKWCYL